MALEILVNTGYGNGVTVPNHCLHWSSAMLTLHHRNPLAFVAAQKQEGRQGDSPGIHWRCLFLPDDHSISVLGYCLPKYTRYQSTSLVWNLYIWNHSHIHPGYNELKGCDVKLISWIMKPKIKCAWIMAYIVSAIFPYCVLTCHS